MLRQRWLGTVPYGEAHDLQRALFRSAADDYLLLLEHRHVYTLGLSADKSNMLVDPASVGAELLRTDRGGDVTYHGPGQLVGYPILTVPGKRGGGMADTVKYVSSVEQLIIDVLGDLGVGRAGRLRGLPGVWIDHDRPQPRKIAAIGVRLSRGRSMHGFALNVDPELVMFDHIVPCGIDDKAVTSIRAEGNDADMAAVVEAMMLRSAQMWGADGVDRQEILWRSADLDAARLDMAPFTKGIGGAGPLLPKAGDLAPKAVGSITSGLTIGPPKARTRLETRRDKAGITGEIPIRERKPDWLRVKLDMGQEFLDLKRTMRSHDLVTVCEEASCPNIFECWNEGTATFMINGERCTRACGFCHVDTRKPEALAADEPRRVASAVVEMGLRHAVVTAVARDDLADGGASAFANTIRAIREAAPLTRVEVLISDCRGDADALDLIFDARPDVLNHNLETVARLQRVVRPSAGYARSLAVLARAKNAGLTTKSGLIVGMGEEPAEVESALCDLGAIGCDIVTIGQYLRPTSNHLAVHRWVEPSEFDQYRAQAKLAGIGHVESSPLTRSSYHAGSAADHLFGASVSISN